MKNITGRLTLIAILLAPMAAHSAAILQTNDAGVLTGANAVDVDGASYDVAFVDGNCIGLYHGCNGPEDFLFNTLESATLASQALLDQVLVGLFDDDPTRVNGCHASYNDCWMLTPYLSVSSNTARTAVAVNRSNQQGGADWVNSSNDIYNYYLTDRHNSRYTYAVWSRPAVSATVTEPVTLALWALGLAAIGVVRRKAARDFIVHRPEHARCG